MQLAKFILANIEPILAEWEDFAATLEPGETMSKLDLRDDAKSILLATARGMQDHQSVEEQASKSKGDGGADTTQSDRLDDASVQHAGERVASGFDLDEVVAEYRALRASILRLWRKSDPQPDLHDIDDITRLNESIDQSLAVAVDSYTTRVSRSRQLFLAILGHDLRNPLNCIRMSAHLIALKNEDVESAEMLAVIGTEVEAMDRLIRDLIDFSSTWLGSSIPLHCEPVDLKKLCFEVVSGFRATHPDQVLHFHRRGELMGNWDAARLRQVVSNLLGNAFQHGATEQPIKLSVAAKGATVVLSVHNEGTPIPREALPTLFDPLVRHTNPDSSSQRISGSVGLGLYIAHEIIHATGGTITVASTKKKGTTFTVRLPRQPPNEGTGPRDA